MSVVISKESIKRLIKDVKQLKLEPLVASQQAGLKNFLISVKTF